MHFPFVEHIPISIVNKLILPLKVPADAAFMQNFKTTLKTTKRNRPQRKLHCELSLKLCMPIAQDCMKTGFKHL